MWQRLQSGERLQPGKAGIQPREGGLVTPYLRGEGHGMSSSRKKGGDSVAKEERNTELGMGPGEPMCTHKAE